MSDKTTYILELVVLTFLGVVLLIFLVIRSFYRSRNEAVNDHLPVIEALRNTETRLGSKIDGMRQHHDVNLDSVAADTKTIRRTVDWIKMQWEKFSRPGGDGR